MKVDLYTRIVLTIIAVSLSVIVLRDIPIIPEASADTMAQRRAAEQERKMKEWERQYRAEQARQAEARARSHQPVDVNIVGVGAFGVMGRALPVTVVD